MIRNLSAELVPFLTIDKKSNNVIQNIYIFEVVSGDNIPELKILDTIKAVKDPGSGCNL